METIRHKYVRMEPLGATKEATGVRKGIATFGGWFWALAEDDDSTSETEEEVSRLASDTWISVELHHRHRGDP